jgi:hypothetical protein
MADSQPAVPFMRWLLILTNRFPDVEFDAEIVSTIITDYLAAQGFSPALVSKYTPKRISNDLDRLYKMGFLGARRVKRPVTTKKGTTCYRGYKYNYYVTVQGKRYYNYLLNPAESTQRSRRRMYEISYKRQWAMGLPPGIFGRLPPELADVDGLYKEIQARSSNAGRYNRFPYISDYTVVIKYINAKQMLYSMLNEQDRPLLYQLDQLSQLGTQIFMESLEKRKKTMLEPDSDCRYLSGLLRRY